MRLLIAALVLTLAIAVTASVFAIWPVVADAPWEEDAPVMDRANELRCEGALSYRKVVLERFGTSGFSFQGWSEQLRQAEREIERFC